jgi:2'-5' RNA ligase
VEANRPASAVIVRVPIPAPLERLRRRWDRAAGLGVPSHVTLLFPFLDATALDGAARRTIADVAAGVAPFTVRFERIGRFPNVLYLAPEPADPFRRLTFELAAKFPDHPPYGGAFDDVIPHLTIAWNAEAPFEAIAGAVRAALPVERPVSSLEVLIQTTDDRWHGHWRIPLGHPSRARRSVRP